MELTEEKIVELKKKYGKVYKVVLAGQTYVYRSIERVEYKDIQSTMQSKDGIPIMNDPSVAINMEDKMVKLCLLYPENISNFDKLPAGVPASLSSYIAEVSGFGVAAEPIEL